MIIFVLYGKTFFIIPFKVKGKSFILNENHITDNNLNQQKTLFAENIIGWKGVQKTFVISENNTKIGWFKDSVMG